MRIIQSHSMPSANGHYSQCVEHGGVFYLSGQLPVDPMSKSVPEKIEEQTLLALTNINAVLEASGNRKEDVIQVRIYLVGIEHWDIVDNVYSTFFGDHKPARCIVPVPALHFGCLIEIEAIASPATVGGQS